MRRSRDPPVHAARRSRGRRVHPDRGAGVDGRFGAVSSDGPPGRRGHQARRGTGPFCSGRSPTTRGDSASRSRGGASGRTETGRPTCQVQINRRPCRHRCRRSCRRAPRGESPAVLAAREHSPPRAALQGLALGKPAVSTPVFIPPTTRTAILPTYPRSARRSGLEGVVKVAAVVDESGKVTSAEVLSSSGHGSLDQAAVEAVRRAAFDPALQDGRPIACRIVIPVRFKLAAKPN